MKHLLCARAGSAYFIHGTHMGAELPLATQPMKTWIGNEGGIRLKSQGPLLRASHSLPSQPSQGCGRQREDRDCTQSSLGAGAAAPSRIERETQEFSATFLSQLQVVLVWGDGEACTGESRRDGQN